MKNNEACFETDYHKGPDEIYVNHLVYHAVSFNHTGQRNSQGPHETGGSRNTQGEQTLKLTVQVMKRKTMNLIKKDIGYLLR